MQNNLLGSLFFKKKKTYSKQLIKISFFKTTSKQLIYAKQLIRISFFKITYSK